MRGVKKREPSELLSATAGYLAQRSNESLVIAVEASYLPHGGCEVFWLYERVSHFECHSAYRREDGSMTVRACDVPRSKVMEFLDLEQFYGWTDAESECADGLCFEIAISEPTRCHAISGLDVASGNQPQTQLFWQIANLFPKREPEWENETA